MKHVGIDIKLYHLDTFNKQVDVNFIDLDSELVDLNYKVASLIFCHVWRSILFRNGSVHKFYHLKALITLEQVITSVVEKKNNLYQQNFEVYTAKPGSRIGD